MMLGGQQAQSNQPRRPWAIDRPSSAIAPSRSSQEAIDHMRGLGWRAPDEDRREFDAETPNFDMYVAPDAVPTLVELLVESLRYLGARPGDLDLQSSH